MTTTIFLRFPDQAMFMSVMPAGAQPMGETFDRLPDGITATSVIGPDATGYLVNALGTLPATWVQYQITPTPGTPVRVFGS